MKPHFPRRSFLAGAAACATLSLLPSRRSPASPILPLGQGTHRYQPLPGWGVLDAAKYPVTNCHEMVEDAKGRIILFQTNARNNILIYDKGGKLLESWGQEYPGAHGLALVHENGEDFLFLTDTSGWVYKTDLKGRQILKLGRPVESDKYPTDADPKKQPKYSPTNVMPAPDGSFFVGDGYGSSYILHYDHQGKFLNIFGGKGSSADNLHTPHGGMVDLPTEPGQAPTLLICSRGEKILKRLTLDGKHLSSHPMPGLSISQIRKQGGHYFIPSLEGVVSVLDAQLKVVSNLGGTAPEWDAQGQLQPVSQVDLAGKAVPPKPKRKSGEANSPTPDSVPQTAFIHPHGIWPDAEGCLYVPQWNSNNTYPIKLVPALQG